MDDVFIFNKSDPSSRPVAAKYCNTFLTRLRGLMLRRQLPDNEGLLLVEKKDDRLNAAIHMMMVFFDITVVWINSDKVVVDVRLARSWRPMYVPRSPARYILEMNSNHINDFNIGDEVSFEDV